MSPHSHRPGSCSCTPCPMPPAVPKLAQDGKRPPGRRAGSAHCPTALAENPASEPAGFLQKALLSGCTFSLPCYDPQGTSGRVFKTHVQQHALTLQETARGGSCRETHDRETGAHAELGASICCCTRSCAAGVPAANLQTPLTVLSY